MIIRINRERNGIEVAFPANPGVKITQELGLNGFRWHPKKKYWWAKHTYLRMAFVERLQKELKERA